MKNLIFKPWIFLGYLLCFPALSPWLQAQNDTEERFKILNQLVKSLEAQDFDGAAKLYPASDQAAVSDFFKKSMKAFKETSWLELNDRRSKSLDLIIKSFSRITDSQAADGISQDNNAWLIQLICKTHIGDRCIPLYFQKINNKWYADPKRVTHLMTAYLDVLKSFDKLDLSGLGIKGLQQQYAHLSPREQDFMVAKVGGLKHFMTYKEHLLYSPEEKVKGGLGFELGKINLKIQNKDLTAQLSMSKIDYSHLISFEQEPEKNLSLWINFKLFYEDEVNEVFGQTFYDALKSKTYSYYINGYKDFRAALSKNLEMSTPVTRVSFAKSSNSEDAIIYCYRLGYLREFSINYVKGTYGLKKKGTSHTWDKQAQTLVDTKGQVVATGIKDAGSFILACIILAYHFS